MNTTTQSIIKSILITHIEAACDDIANQELDCGYFSEDYAGRMAEILVQVLAIQKETSEIATAE